MNPTKCLDLAVSQGRMKREEADHINDLFERYSRNTSDPYVAKSHLIDAMEKNAKRKRDIGILQAKKQKHLLEMMETVTSIRGLKDPVAFLEKIMEHHGGYKFQDVSHREAELMAQFQGKMQGMLDHFRKGYFSGDLRRTTSDMKADLEMLAKELFGEPSGSQRAADFATAFAEVSETARTMFNAASGGGEMIGKLEHKRWGLPQSHDSVKIGDTPKHQWVEETAKLLDRQAMRNWAQDGSPMTDDELTIYLGHVYDHITTNGASAREAGALASGQSALYKSHSDPRFLHFKDSKSWMEYNAKYGIGDVYETIVGHMATMARDIALMDVLGPNPHRMFKILTETVRDRYKTGEYGRGNLHTRQADIDDVMTRIDKIGGQLKDGPRKTELSAKLSSLHKKVDGLRKPSIKRALKAQRLANEAKKKSILKEIEKVEEELYAEVPESLGEVEHARVTADLRAGFEELHRMEDIPFDKMRGRSGKTSSINAKIELANGMFDLQAEVLDPNAIKLLADVGAISRNIITASSLGSAVVSAVSDHGFGLMTRRFIGLRASGQVTDFVRMFSKETRDEMVKSEMILDNAIRALHLEARNGLSINTKTWSGFIADRVIGITGLAGWTQAAKHAFSYEFMNFLAVNSRKTFQKLDPKMRATLKRHNISEADWNVIRNVEQHSFGGAKFLRSNEIRQVNPELATKYHSMITRERAYAVPEATLKTRAIATAGGKSAGTVAGEFGRGVFLFKSFAVTVAMMHVGRTLRELYGAGGARSAAEYMGGLMVATTLLGAMAVQLKEMKKGRTPREMSSPGFWAAAMFQGGGMGLFGDTLQSLGNNRFGGGPMDSFAGPLYGRLDKLTKGLADLSGGDPTKILKETGRLVPGSNAWFAQAAWEGLVIDTISRYSAGKKKYNKTKKRFAKQQKENFGNSLWWE